MDAHIALVENDVPTNRALARLLRISGFTVAPYHSAEQFLECLALGAPSCLIADIDLDGMSGIELQAVLRQRHPALPVIVITGGTDRETRARAEALGCSAFLHKPVGARQLLDAIVLAIAGRLPFPSSTPSL